MWRMCDLACFLSPLVVDVVLPVLMQRQALAVLVSYSGGATDSVLRRYGVPVLGLWLQAKAGSHCFQGANEGVEQFHAFPMRSLALSALGLWTLLLRTLVSGRHLPRCSRISLRWLLEEFFVLLAPEPSAHGNLDTISASLIGWSLSRNAWFESGFMFLVFSYCLWTNFRYFLVKGSSDPAVESRLALSCCMATLIVDNGSCMYFTGLGGIHVPRAVF